MEEEFRMPGFATILLTPMGTLMKCWGSMRGKNTVFICGVSLAHANGEQCSCVSFTKPLELLYTLRGVNALAIELLL